MVDQLFAVRRLCQKKIKPASRVPVKTSVPGSGVEVIVGSIVPTTVPSVHLPRSPVCGVDPAENDTVSPRWASKKANSLVRSEGLPAVRLAWIVASLEGENIWDHSELLIGTLLFRPTTTDAESRPIAVTYPEIMPAGSVSIMGANVDAGSEAPMSWIPMVAPGEEGVQELSATVHPRNTT